MSEILLSSDQFKALLKGNYSLRPCAECDLGTIYVNGDIGEQISVSEYHRLNDEEFEYLYTEECSDCLGVGKIVIWEDS